MRKIRWAIQIIVPLALAFFIYSSWGDLGDVWNYIVGGEVGGRVVQGFTLVSLLILALQIPAQIFSYAGVAHFYHSYFNEFSGRVRVRLRDLYLISLELNFINSVLPSGGVSGLSYLGLRLRPKGVTMATSTIAQGLRFCLTFISFIPILALAILLMALDPHTNNLMLLYGSGVLSVMVLAVLIGWFLISDSRRIRKLVNSLPTVMRWLAQRIPVLKNQSFINIAKVNRVLNEVHADYMTLKEQPRRLLEPFNYALAINLFELLSVYVAYLAFYPVFGELVNPGTIVLAYMTANLAGLIAVLPGGIGVFEGLMVWTLTNSLVDAPQDFAFLALAGAVVYRVINLAVFVPIGYVLYQAAAQDLGELKPDSTTG